MGEIEIFLWSKNGDKGKIVVRKLKMHVNTVQQEIFEGENFRKFCGFVQCH